ncbi:hypothetical protein PoB_001494100 [Plakobranchus ocellatus]|uniref:DDE Tnp4 domain-containing protein n=1 Tax=Plakobranchus ocellatus TaxID=259542 RepID=A0AAV3Z1I2_9GAST|nr:hypothetical protein PoB_001494100 [Plakobranchus ocellatus]
MFRFKRANINYLRDGLLIPDHTVTTNRLNISGTEALCIFLRRLSYPNRLVNHNLEHIFSHFSHKVSWLNQRWIPKQALADAVAAKGAPIQNCISFIDGTIKPIARPSSNQCSSYSKHKRLHGLKFQSVMLLNGIIGHIFGPMEGKHYDCALLAANGLIAELETIGDFCLYGDQAYPLRRTLISPFRGAALSPPGARI